MSGGDRKTLTPCNHMAFANHVHDYSRFILCYQPAFGASTLTPATQAARATTPTRHSRHTRHTRTRHPTDGVGVKIVNNKIHTAPHNAILLGESNNVEIYFN